MFNKLIAPALLILCCSSAYAEQVKKPFVYQAMDNIKLPYTERCMPDPEVVQEYLLEMEIDYLRWLVAEYAADMSNADSQDKVSYNLAELALDNALERLVNLRQKCAK